MSEFLGFNIADWVLIGAIIMFAWAGWRQGFVAGLLSFAGFIGGGLVATFAVPLILERVTLPETIKAMIVVVAVVACAVIGQLIASILGRRLRSGITWSPAVLVDRLGGVTLNVIALALILWVVASAVAFLPNSTVASQIRTSRVITGLDSVVPDQARDAIMGLRDFVGSSDVPRVFAGIGEITGPEVDAPDEVVTHLATVEAARDSIVKVQGPTADCNTDVSGSGFVVSSERVLTNAHVVAGVEQPYVSVRRNDPLLPATVVAFDPKLDVAVLYVPGLMSPPLMFATTPATHGESAVVAGFPHGGSFEATAARVRAIVNARGEDIYGRAGVAREVYSLRSTVVPGNSGGPLLSVRGAVLGMVFAAGIENPETGYALTAAQLQVVLEGTESRTKAVPNGSCRVRD